MEGPGPCHGLSVNGDPIPFETELFKGVVAVYVRHLPTTPTHLFKGKKRLTWVALQVRYGACFPSVSNTACAACVLTQHSCLFLCTSSQQHPAGLATAC